MSNTAESVVDVKVVPFDDGHDIDDSGVAVDEGLGVDEAESLLYDARLALMSILPRCVIHSLGNLPA